MNICLSGGAQGADLAWGDEAYKNGHSVCHFVFAGHKSPAPSEQKMVLSDEELRVADDSLLLANKTLKRRWPVKNLFVANLLRRNYYQIFDSDAVYAISSFENGMVKGGTAWAVQMFVDRHLGNPCPAYVYDQEHAVWNKWEGLWTIIDRPPAPSGTWAGIGTRELNMFGLQAISKCF